MLSYSPCKCLFLKLTWHCEKNARVFGVIYLHFKKIPSQTSLLFLLASHADADSLMLFRSKEGI